MPIGNCFKEAAYMLASLSLVEISYPARRYLLTTLVRPQMDLLMPVESYRLYLDPFYLQCGYYSLCRGKACLSLALAHLNFSVN